MSPMDRASSIIACAKASLHNSLLQGLALAVAMHMALLSPQLKFTELSKHSAAPVSLSIQLEKIEIDNKPPDLIEQEQQKETPRQVNGIDLGPKVMVAEVPVDDPKPEHKPRIHISTSAESFKYFLQSETNRNVKPKQDKLSEFAATFPAYFEATEITPETSYRDFQGVLGGGQYKVYKNGKVTCVLNMVPLSFDDHVYGAGGGTKDCTPKAKFDLNLRENTNKQKRP